LLIALARLSVWLYATNRPNLLFEPVSRCTRTAGSLIVPVPAANYTIAILISHAAPAASLAIYAAAPVVYFIALLVERSTVSPGSRDDGFT
jgi:hypothetical protein